MLTLSWTSWEWTNPEWRRSSHVQSTKKLSRAQNARLSLPDIVLLAEHVVELRGIHCCESLVRMSEFSRPCKTRLVRQIPWQIPDPTQLRELLLTTHQCSNSFGQQG